jgi:hypothetical protein
MIHLSSWPVIILEYGLAVFCFLDVVLMRETQVRWMPRAVWALLLLCFPVAGSIGWIAAGRPWRHHKLLPDDIQPDEPTRPGDPFHHDPHLGPGSPGPHEPRRSRDRPPRRQHDEPAPPGSGPADRTQSDAPHHSAGPVHDDHHGRDRWRWHGRPRRRPGRLGAPPGESPPPTAGESRPDRPEPGKPEPGKPEPGRSGTGEPGAGPDSGRYRPGPGTRPAPDGSPAGRGPASRGPLTPGGPTPPVGIPLPRPDVPPGAERPAPETDLISQLFAVHEEHERTLRRWEEDLLRREEELRRQAEQLATPPAVCTPATEDLSGPAGAVPGAGASPEPAGRPAAEPSAEPSAGPPGELPAAEPPAGPG